MRWFDSDRGHSPNGGGRISPGIGIRGGGGMKGSPGGGGPPMNGGGGRNGGGGKTPRIGEPGDSM